MRNQHTRENNRDNREKRIETEGITIRLDKGMLRRLKSEAKEKQISTNILISQIFGRHLEWHSSAARAGFVAVRRGTILKLLDNTSEDQIREVARFVGSSESRDFVLVLRHEYSLTSALNVLETWLKISGYSYKHQIRLNSHSLVIQHDMGKKWSVYLSEIYRSVFEEFGQRDARFVLTENTVHVSYEDAIENK